MTTKNPRMLVEDFLAGRERETVHEVLALGRGLRRDALLRQMRLRLQKHPDAHRTFQELINEAIILEMK